MIRKLSLEETTYVVDHIKKAYEKEHEFILKNGEGPTGQYFNRYTMEVWSFYMKNGRKQWVFLGDYPFYTNLQRKNPDLITYKTIRGVEWFYIGNNRYKVTQEVKDILCK